MIAMMAVCAFGALGMLRLYRLAFPTAPPLAAQARHWERQRARAARHTNNTISIGGDSGAGYAGYAGVLDRAGHPSRPESGDQSWLSRVLEWGGEELRARRPEEMATFERDLAVTGQPLEGWLTRTLLWMLTGFLAPVVLLGVASSAGLAVPLSYAPLVGLGFAAVMLIGQVSDLQARAAAGREDLRQALAIYLDLVVMSMEGGRGHAEALPTVAGIGTGWSFNTLHDAIDNARTHAITPWEALGRLGERYGIPELLDLRAALTLAQDEGGSIRKTLIARAQTMRSARITEAHARADKATDAMRNNLMLMALLAAAYVITARILFLFTA